jgi:hypothetical protein
VSAQSAGRGRDLLERSKRLGLGHSCCHQAVRYLEEAPARTPLEHEQARERLVKLCEAAEYLAALRVERARWEARVSTERMVDPELRQLLRELTTLVAQPSRHLGEAEQRVAYARKLAQDIQDLLALHDETSLRLAECLDECGVTDAAAAEGSRFELEYQRARLSSSIREVACWLESWRPSSLEVKPETSEDLGDGLLHYRDTLLKQAAEVLQPHEVEEHRRLLDLLSPRRSTPRARRVMWSGLHELRRKIAQTLSARYSQVEAFTAVVEHTGSVPTKGFWGAMARLRAIPQSEREHVGYYLKELLTALTLPEPERSRGIAALCSLLEELPAPPVRHNLHTSDEPQAAPYTAAQAHQAADAGGLEELASGDPAEPQARLLAEEER